jgi:hypothetical protein
MDEAHVALGAEVGFGVLNLQQLFLGGLHRLEHGRGAGVGAVDAHAQVNLVLAGVRIVELDQRQKRVGGLLLEVRKHARALSLGAKGASLKAHPAQVSLNS